MGTALKLANRYDYFRAWVYRILRWPYAVAALGGYLLTWALVLAYLAKAPVYTSDLALVLPGTGSNNNVSLADVGQVSSQTLNPFSTSSFNPLLNYKAIITDRNVLIAAGKKLGISMEAFGLPRVVLTEQTSILKVTLEGGASVEVQRKAMALYEAFQGEITRLRADEAQHRAESMKAVLEQYRVNLNEARQKIMSFQQHSLVIATTQLAQLTATSASLREKLLYAQAEQRKLDDYVQQLSRDLGVSPALAGQAFALQSDSVYQGYLAELTASAGQLSDYSSRWGPNHPKVKTISKRYEQASLELANRSRQVQGVVSGDLLNQLNLQASPHRAQLFADLVSSYAHLKGSEAELGDLQLAEQSVQDKLRIYSREAAELERLEHDYQLAEAVFTSVVARLEAGKSDIFASYPVVQLLMPPSQNFFPKSPRLALGLAAGAAGCFFISMAILVLWQRRYLINLLLKKS